MAPVLWTVIFTIVTFSVTLYELEQDAMAAQKTIYQIRAFSNKYTSELREYLINTLGGRDNGELAKEIKQLSEKLHRSLKAYTYIAEELEAATPQSLSKIKNIILGLDSIASSLTQPGLDIYGANEEIENIENEIKESFELASRLVNDEIEFETALLFWCVVGVSLISLLFSFIFVQKISKKIVAQILMLRTVTMRIGEGDFSERAEISSGSELGQLSGAFNEMADALEKTLNSLETEIDRRKSSEKELLNIQTTLEQRIKKRSDELKNSYQQLAHAGRLNALGEMAAGIAHEIRQPLAIIGLANLQLKDFFDKKNANLDMAVSSVGKIKEQIDRADTIIHHMNSFARTDFSDFSYIDLAEPVKIAASFFKEQCRIHQIELRIENDEPVPLVRANLQKIEQIVINLISNSRYAVEKKARKSKTKFQMQIILKIYHDAKKKMAVLEIADNGNGMTTEEREHCLNPFYTTKQVGQGTGLGLSIVYNIVREFMGKMEIESKEGIGSTFRILLPVKEE